MLLNKKGIIPTPSATWPAPDLSSFSDPLVADPLGAQYRGTGAENLYQGKIGILTFITREVWPRPWSRQACDCTRR